MVGRGAAKQGEMAREGEAPREGEGRATLRREGVGRGVCVRCARMCRARCRVRACGLSIAIGEPGEETRGKRDRDHEFGYWGRTLPPL